MRTATNSLLGFFKVFLLLELIVVSNRFICIAYLVSFTFHFVALVAFAFLVYFSINHLLIIHLPHPYFIYYRITHIYSFISLIATILSLSHVAYAFLILARPLLIGLSNHVAYRPRRLSSTFVSPSILVMYLDT
jgi:hypothetical protein